MEYRAFEQRLLDTIFTTEVQLTPATIAYLYKIQVQEAADLLQQAAVNGLLNIESDEEGNLLYSYPNRVRLPPRDPNARGEPRPGERPPPTPQMALTLARGDTAAAVPYRPGEGAPAPPTNAPVALAPTVVAEEGRELQPSARCPFCNEIIVIGAKKCKHCHEYLDYTLRDLHHGPRHAPQVNVALQPIAHQPGSLVPWNGLQPALLSFFVPGLGQICTGRVPAGLLWMMFTLIGYIPLVVPGLILHILCVINAAKPPRQAT